MAAVPLPPSFGVICNYRDTLLFAANKGYLEVLQLIQAQLELYCTDSFLEGIFATACWDALCHYHLNIVTYFVSLRDRFPSLFTPEKIHDMYRMAHHDFSNTKGQGQAIVDLLKTTFGHLEVIQTFVYKPLTLEECLTPDKDDDPPSSGEEEGFN